MPKSKKQEKSYRSVLIEEEMSELGENICWFRNLWKELDRQGVYDIQYADAVYQHAFDKIIDSLCNVNDLKCAESAITAIDKSMKIRRGMKKF